MYYIQLTTKSINIKSQNNLIVMLQKVFFFSTNIYFFCEQRAVLLVTNRQLFSRIFFEIKDNRQQTNRTFFTFEYKHSGIQTKIRSL
jgi:hypothetical protein